jgi:hypothetical protein
VARHARKRLIETPSLTVRPPNESVNELASRDSSLASRQTRGGGAINSNVAKYLLIAKPRWFSDRLQPQRKTSRASSLTSMTVAMLIQDRRRSYTAGTYDKVLII